MINWLSDLLDALERHSQALQANTAAVHSLIQAGPRAAAADPAALQRRLAEQLEETKAITARLEALRAELAATPDPVCVRRHDTST